MSWQLVLAGPDQAGHKAELIKEASRLGLSVADVSVDEQISQDEARTPHREQGMLRKSTTVTGCLDSASEPCRFSPFRHSSFPDIVFTGPVYGQDKDALYRRANLFALPSFTENFGVVVADALSYGVPVITTKGAPWEELRGRTTADCEPVEGNCQASTVCGESRAVNDQSTLDKQVLTENDSLLTKSHSASGRCGWWIEIGVAPLVEALQDAMALTDEERIQMGENGRRLVATRYTWPAIAEQMKAAYVWLLHGGQMPQCIFFE